MIVPSVPPHLRSALTLILPTDFSPAAERALPVALALGERLQADLHLVHVLNDATGIAAIREEQRARARLEATRMLYRYSLPHRHSLPLRLVVLQGGPPESVVVNYAAQQQAAFIVMGMRGWEAQGERRPGTTAARVAERSACPVLLVPPHAAAGKEIRHVVACGDAVVAALGRQFSEFLGARCSVQAGLRDLPPDSDVVVLPHTAVAIDPDFTGRFCGEDRPCLALVIPASSVASANLAQVPPATALLR